MLLAAFTMVAGLSQMANAAYILSTFSYDKDVSNGSFGTLLIQDFDSNNVPLTNALIFTIDVSSTFGPKRDIEQFGFNVDGYSGSLSVAQISPILNPPLSPTVVQNLSVKGSGSGSPIWDYVVDFGQGTSNGSNQPAVFKLSGGVGFDIFKFVDTLESQTNVGGLAWNFGVHVQTTLPDPPGSQFLAGKYGAIDLGPGPGAGQVPEPFTAGLMLSGMALSGFVIRRRRK